MYMPMTTIMRAGAQPAKPRTSGPLGPHPSAGALKRRFFIAVMPPEKITAPLDDLRQQGPAHWDWKRHKDLHISLAFPGPLNQTQLKKLINVLSKVEHKAFPLNFSGLDCFMRDPFNRKQASSLHVLWARPETRADAHLRSLHAEIIDHLKRHKFAAGRRDIVPHLTVAKVPAHDHNLVSHFAAAHAHKPTPSFQCDRFGIYETLEKNDPRHPDHNNGQGSRYVKVAEFILK
ncbi:MAG: RNA 2',3'-cyclic phosphodiesterase [Alphaproteobacteria bacterium]|nr:RNA 2',3'-cyclic phosphodiesterase [Alphaproteobacteria bacterium]